MAYTAPTSARVWNAPRGGTVSCMDPHSHLVDTLRLGGYKSNQEVSEFILLFGRKTKPNLDDRYCDETL